MGYHYKPDIHIEKRKTVEETLTAWLRSNGIETASFSWSIKLDSITIQGITDTEFVQWLLGDWEWYSIEVEDLVLEKPLWLEDQEGLVFEVIPTPSLLLYDEERPLRLNRFWWDMDKDCTTHVPGEVCAREEKCCLCAKLSNYEEGLLMTPQS